MIAHKLFYFHRFYVEKVLQIPVICSLMLSKTIFSYCFSDFCHWKAICKNTWCIYLFETRHFVLIWREIKKMWKVVVRNAFDLDLEKVMKKFAGTIFQLYLHRQTFWCIQTRINKVATGAYFCDISNSTIYFQGLQLCYFYIYLPFKWRSTFKWKL